MSGPDYVQDREADDRDLVTFENAKQTLVTVAPAGAGEVPHRFLVLAGDGLTTIDVEPGSADAVALLLGSWLRDYARGHQPVVGLVDSIFGTVR